MLDKKLFEKLTEKGRKVAPGKAGDKDLDALKLLPGVWSNEPGLPGRGWNMIALPFKAEKGNLNYRLLVNQYNETLSFTTVDKAVPNRGLERKRGTLVNSDQFVNTLDYTQGIVQVAADDFPRSGKAGGSNLAIHHEPGLFLQMANHVTEDYEIARLGSVPHGNSVFALGRVRVLKGAPQIPDELGLPLGIPQDLDSKYLSPYKHFHDNKFRGIFDPVHPNELLKEANRGVNIVRTTELHFDTRFATGGINNIPFIERQADATEMHATFWIQELKEKDEKGKPKLRLQYTQTVQLDFFKMNMGKPQLIKWPHVSINTMEKIS